MTEQNYKAEQKRETSATVCVIGLGYVGLPVALAFDDAGYVVRGIDIDRERIKTLNEGEDPTSELGDEAVAESEIQFTTEARGAATADYVIVTVPTPVDDLKKPDLGLVEQVGETIGQQLEPRTTVVLESTVYPGATREVFVPALERESGLTAGEKFYVGYSPERMVPGDNKYGLRNVVKIVSALTDETRTDLARLYESVVNAGVHEAPSIETAEAAKCVENTQRDINIALMNELAVTCAHLGLDTKAVLDAAGTKWNFHDYQPGLVGGHCIPVDPFYLIYETERNGFEPELIEKARAVNEYVPTHIGKMTIKALNEAEKVLGKSRILVLGLAYKPDVGDIRTSAIGGVIETLREYDVNVVGFDPHAEDEAIRDEFGIDVQGELSVSGFDGLVVGTAHSTFHGLDFGDLAHEMEANPVLIDVDGTFRKQATEHDFIYWRL